MSWGFHRCSIPASVSSSSTRSEKLGVMGIEFAHRVEVQAEPPLPSRQMIFRLRPLMMANGVGL